jgi:FIMAH domain-containing protein
MRTLWRILCGIFFATLPLGVLHAATIDQIMQQVSAYRTSGDIRDGDLAASLLRILGDAKFYGSAGDTAARNNYLEAFRDTVSANSGDLVSSGAATTLIGMAAQ